MGVSGVPLSYRTTVRVVNDFLHDIAAGVGPGAVLALWVVSNGAKATVDPVVLAGMTRSWSWIVLVLFVQLVVLVVTGIVRLSYHYLGVSEDAVKAKGRMALIKHGLFVLLFVAVVVEAFALLNG